MEIMSFEEALEHANSKPGYNHLLLGNGFSRALRDDVFSYDSLYEQAVQDRKDIEEIFEKLGTTNFEKVIRALESAADMTPLFAEGGSTSESMRDKALEIKELLIETVARHHPDRPRDISDDAYACCQEFLRNFLNNKGNVFTLNYDLLLYWTLMHDYESGNDLYFRDGFTSPDEADATYVEFGKFVFDINIYYLHGAMHLFDAGHQLQKYTWVRKGEALKEQANTAMDAGKFPLFVAEGSFEKKLEKIKHSGYLELGLRNFQDTHGKLFVFGVSFADQDKHIADAIDRGKFSDLYVSIKGDPDASANRELIHRVEEIARSREERLRAKGKTPTPMGITFFDADSAQVWG